MELERRILQALCCAAATGPAREAAKQQLASYRWQEAFHHALFEILCTLPPLTADALREQLPSRLTRRGFPDVDWEVFLEPADTTTAELEELIRELLAFGD